MSAKIGKCKQQFSEKCKVLEEKLKSIGSVDESRRYKRLRFDLLSEVHSTIGEINRAKQQLNLELDSNADPRHQPSLISVMTHTSHAVMGDFGEDQCDLDASSQVNPVTPHVQLPPHATHAQQPVSATHAEQTVSATHVQLPPPATHVNLTPPATHVQVQHTVPSTHIQQSAYAQQPVSATHAQQQILPIHVPNSNLVYNHFGPHYNHPSHSRAHIEQYTQQPRRPQHIPMPHYVNSNIEAQHPHQP